MKLLALETCTEACSAALAVDKQVTTRCEIAPRRHAELILPMVDELLAEAGIGLRDLDAIAFGRGPGAFTGVRICTGVAQGLAFGAGLLLVPISTLAALAQGAADRATRVLSAIDARMGEIYWGGYEFDDAGLAIASGDERVEKPAELAVPEAGDWYGVGSGWETHGAVLEQRFGGRLAGRDGNRFPEARHMLPLALRELRVKGGLAPEDALPVYLRNRVTG